MRKKRKRDGVRDRGSVRSCVCVLHKTDKRRVKDTQIEFSNGSESLYVSESDCSSQASEVYKLLPSDFNRKR